MASRPPFAMHGPFTNHISTIIAGKKIAVIENEFGEVGIDDGLVMQAVETKEEIFEMNNGCICCTVRGDLIRILHKLLKRRSKFDAILIETTGLANPAPVIQTFFVDEEIKEAVFLDAVLTVVDSKHVTQHLDEEKPEGVVNEAVQQIAFADKVLLNKIDLLASEAEKAALLRRVRSINPGVEIIECTRSQVDINKIIGIKAFDLGAILADDPAFLNTASDRHHEHEGHEHGHHEGHECTDACAHDHDHHHHHEGEGEGEDHKCTDECKHEHEHDKSHSHDHHHHDHKHDDRVTSVGIIEEGSCDQSKLNEWLGALLKERGPDLFRSKGILSVHGSEDRHVFQGVHMLLQFSSSSEGACPPWREGEARVNKLVFIGKNLDRKELTESFRACLAVPK